MSSAFFDAVRVHPEPFAYVDERAVHEALVASPRAYLEYLDGSLEAIAAGEIQVEQPSKLVFPDRGSAGDFRVMPCVVRRHGQVRKIVKIVGTNVLQKVVPDQITVGKALCLDSDENYVTHIIEACLLSSARTGACAAIALRKLARQRRHLTIIGSGRVGCYAALYASTVTGVEEITFVDREPERAGAAASLASRLFRSGAVFRAGGPEAHKEADVIVLATTAATAVLGPRDTSAPVVISVGADTEHQHELAPEWGSIADVYVDTSDGLQVGDLLHWTEAGVIRAADLNDLIGLYRKGVQGRRDRRVFISTGSALFDNLTISYLLEGRLGQVGSPNREADGRNRGD